MRTVVRAVKTAVVSVGVVGAVAGTVMGAGWPPMGRWWSGSREGGCGQAVETGGVTPTEGDRQVLIEVDGAPALWRPELLMPRQEWDVPYPTVRPPIRVDWPVEVRPELVILPGIEQLLKIEAAGDAMGRMFTPVEGAGLVAQVTSVGASVTVVQDRQGRPGASVQRVMQMTGTVTDLSGTRAFQIVGRPMLLEMTDQDGASLVGSALWQTYPDGWNPQGFTRPMESGGGALQQTFSLAAQNIGTLPTRIGTLRVAVDVALGATTAGCELSSEVTEEFKEVGTGIAARVAAVRGMGDALLVLIEYRLDLVDGAARAWFARAEIVDDEGRVVHTTDSSQEAHARGCVLGAAQGWGIDPRRTPVWTVRLHFVTAEQTVRMVLEERDVPLMGG